ncbi:hypothetical protein KGF56_003432 [Candida oxycetoniae]|uniref:TRIP4/RQT4 C2HC5-type zinc finger domain-containing protein n=1 Tax=Candida oxycetoniae TaxID=497107 RepID=A0AAI9SVM8_9ASCO|nr:uncharacterized protein KGF56_003432 [Candida oxycetoniae]KAI3403797.2 hypothetical protein KGF56_003432 [Candida oxycetoniae]
MSDRKSITTSQLLKSKDTVSASVPNRLNKKKLIALADIESVLNSLEVSGPSSSSSSSSCSFQGSSSGKRVCNCLARRHPLYEIAPNCLNCGKIICTKEGLQPCSFCGSDILPSTEKDAIVRLLNKEKSDLLNLSQNAEKSSTTFQNAEKSSTTQTKQKKKIVVKMKPGEKFWEAQDRAFQLAEKAIGNREKKDKKNDEPSQITENGASNTTQVDQDLSRAQEKLATLLRFQETGEERTRIIDNASDFEMPTQSLWLSPEERALNLKRHQRMAKEKSREDERSKRGEKQVEMVIKNGKVTMVEKYIPIKEEVSSEELQLIEELKKSKKSQMEEYGNSVWDYDADKRKWEKPIYKSNNTNREMRPKEDRSRVQLEKNDDTIDLVVAAIV